MPTRGLPKKLHLAGNAEIEAACQSPPKLVFIGGQNQATGEPSSLVDTYDITGNVSNDVIRIPQLPGKRLDASLIAKDGDLYMIGGFDGEKSCSSVFKLTQTNMRWKEMCQMTFARNGHTSCLVGDYIVVAGGVGNDMKRTASIEAFDVKNDKWISLPDLPLGPLTSAASCEHNGDFVISGGTGRTNMPLTIVLSLNITTKRWRRLPDLLFRRSHHSMASVAGKLYILGDVINRTVERLHENRSKFVAMGELPVAKCGSSAVVVGDSIILAGGWSQNDPIIRYNVNSGLATTSHIERNCFSPHVTLFRPEVLSLWVVTSTFIRNYLNETLTDSSTEDHTFHHRIQQLPLPKIITAEI